MSIFNIYHGIVPTLLWPFKLLMRVSETRNSLNACCKDNDTNISLCSLDVEKCFDKIWHSGLFYKLSNFLPDIHWRFLLKVV